MLHLPLTGIKILSIWNSKLTELVKHNLDCDDQEATRCFISSSFLLPTKIAKKEKKEGNKTASGSLKFNISTLHVKADLGNFKKELEPSPSW